MRTLIFHTKCVTGIVTSFILQACGHGIHAWPDVNLVVQTQRLSYFGSNTSKAGYDLTLLAEFRWGATFPDDQANDLDLEPSVTRELQ